MQIDTWILVQKVMSGRYEVDHRSFILSYKLPPDIANALPPSEVHEVTLRSALHRNYMELPPEFIIQPPDRVVRLFCPSQSQMNWDEFGTDRSGKWGLLYSGIVPVDLSDRMGRFPVGHGAGFWFTVGRNSTVLSIKDPDVVPPTAVRRLVAAATAGSDPNARYYLTNDAKVLVVYPSSDVAPPGVTTLHWFDKELLRRDLRDIPAADVLGITSIDSHPEFLVFSPDTRIPPLPNLGQDRNHQTFAILDDGLHTLGQFKVNMARRLDAFISSNLNLIDVRVYWDSANSSLLYYPHEFGDDRVLPITIQNYKSGKVFDIVLDLKVIPGRRGSANEISR